MALTTKIFNTPEGFFNAIPKGLAENIDFRKTLHTLLDTDKKLQQVYMAMCIQDPKIAFNSLFWTKNPRKPIGERNYPFILRPKQETAVDALNSCIVNQKDIGINKSRDEGATEIVCKMFALLTLTPESYFIVGSRNKELVDSIGDPYTLMAKIRYVFATLPPWLDSIRKEAMANDKDMQIMLPSLDSGIKGETTNESFSAGRRATAIFLDEFGRVEPRVAESIEGSVHDVTGCVVYGSTHWFGQHHPFAQALKKKTTKVVNLIWYENPEKAAGLYTTPDYDKIIVIDKDYYLRKYPEIFTPAILEKEFRVSELEKELLSRGYDGPSPIFVADACEGLPKGANVRSPWHDEQEITRAGNLRDFISNVWASPIGSQDSFFNLIVLDGIESKYIRKPRHKGEIHFNYNDEGQIVNIKYQEGGKGRLKWWEPLDNGIPDLTHNYVIGCDIALGTGNSNSVAAILDVNTKEVVGMWSCANTPYELFADTVYALHKWLGQAYVVFENNGGHGVNFGRKLIKNGCHRVYSQRTEDSKTKKVKNKWGWSSNPQTKQDLLGELGIALSEGLKINPTYIHCRIHDEELLKELYSYVFYENGDVGSTEFQDVSTGARKRHGDRVIATGLCLLGSKYQMKAPKVEEVKFIPDSYTYRREQVEKEERENRRNSRRYYL